MQPRASRIERDLGELNRLADALFTLVRHEFVTDSTVTMHLDRSDRLTNVRIRERDVANATLLCVQLLRRVTDGLEQAEPRQVLGFADLLDQLIPGLIRARPRDHHVADQLRAIQTGIDAVTMNLAVHSDPGAPGFSTS
jgi:hypothetical protein